MFNFEKTPKKDPAGPPALTSQEMQLRELNFRLALAQAQIANLQEAIIEICQGFRAHIDRIDHNTQLLDQHMHQLAALTLRPPKDLLNGHDEVN